MFRFLVVLISFVLVMSPACKHNDGPTNPYIHKKHKTSEDVSDGFKKRDKAARRAYRKDFRKKHRGVWKNLKANSKPGS